MNTFSKHLEAVDEGIAYVANQVIFYMLRILVTFITISSVTPLFLVAGKSDRSLK